MTNQLKFQKNKIPNYLTVFRMILVPVIIVFMLVTFGGIVYEMKAPLPATFDLSWILAGVLFLIAALTDYIDGYLARKNHWVSDFGKLWDPIADKVLINSVLIVFAYLSLIPIWVVVIMIARDVIVDASRMTAANKNIVVPANFYGKLKTVTQMFAIIFIFFFFKCPEDIVNTQPLIADGVIWWWLVQNLMIFVALFFSVLSGIIYIYQMYKLQAELKKGKVDAKL